MDISILGCGWLGLPLAEHLIRRNHSIKGSTTTTDKVKELKTRSIEPYVIELSPEIFNSKPVTDFWQSEVLVLNIPPGQKCKNVVEYHSKQIQSVIEHVENSPIQFMVFISSTSVYPKYPGTVVENDTLDGKAGRASENALLKTERMLQEQDDFETTIVRFGGLYGGDRHPARFLAGRENLSDAQAPVNLIHQDDCIAIITQIVEEDITSEIFNAVADAHPTRKVYYTKAAKKLGLTPPTFLAEQSRKSYKLVSNKKLKEKLSYRFIHPDLELP